MRGLISFINVAPLGLAWGGAPGFNNVAPLGLGLPRVSPLAKSPNGAILI